MVKPGGRLNRGMVKLSHSKALKNFSAKTWQSHKCGKITKGLDKSFFLWYNTSTIKKGATKVYQIIFDDEVQGKITEDFETFEEAAEFWQDYADTPTCAAGQLWDKSNGELIWQF